ncbi:MAG: 4-hydroxybenzoate 3-monooxygenase [Pseudomonadota bacterium]
MSTSRSTHRTQVAIIGGGPAGLLLSQLLYQRGIDSIVIERRSREYVLQRIRAGVLENGTVELARVAGAGERLKRQGLVHQGITLAHQGKALRVDFEACTGASVTVYGQTELTHDLYAALDRTGTRLFDNVGDVQLHDVETVTPSVEFTYAGQPQRIACDIVAGCDGFHGICRQSIDPSVRREFERIYPFGWLGVLTERPPVSEELIYAGHDRGFALCSMRNPNLSRYYVQVDADDSVDAWSDDRFWDELRQRIPADTAESLATGPSIEKSIAPLRSFVCEPMQWGRLYLCGDAAHIVPPTGAKGLNLAASDVYYLWNALIDHYRDGDSRALDAYSHTALARVWKAERFSWWMTHLLHRYPDQSPFDRRLQRAEFDYLAGSLAAQSVLAENYTGLPY